MKKLAVLLLVIFCSFTPPADSNTTIRISDLESVNCVPPTVSKKPVSLPKSQTKASVTYRIQVAVLKKFDGFPFSEGLVATWDACKQVWVIETELAYSDATSKAKLEEYKALGHKDAFRKRVVKFYNVTT